MTLRGSEALLELRGEVAADLRALGPKHRDLLPARLRLDHPGRHVIMARATNRIGQTQPAQPIANPCGYHHNAMPRVTLMAE